MNVDLLLAKYKDIEGERFFKELFTNNEYEPVLSRKLDTVIDVGALAGEFCAYIYPHAGKIYALEPFLPHFKELQENIAEFKLEKIIPFRMALGGNNGVARITTTDGRGGNKLTTEIEGSGLVSVKTLAQFIKDAKIAHVDLLKIDIEGGEAQVFEAGDFPSVANRIDAIIGEHLQFVKDNLLESLGFTKITFQGNANALYVKDSTSH